MSFRVKAFSIHLFFSIVVAIFSLFLVFVVWHSSPLQKAVGVTFIYFIMLIVDVILGPLLTLILAKQGKKGLKFDLVTVAIIQLVAYVYGMYNIALSRPVWIVFDTFRFDLVQLNDIDRTNTENADDEYVRPSWFGPRFVSVRPIKNAIDKNNRLFYEIENGFAPSKRPELYQSLDDAWRAIEDKQKPLAMLKQYNSADKIARIVNYYPKSTGWIPLKANNKDMVVLVDKNKHSLNIVDLRPWKK